MKCFLQKTLSILLLLLLIVPTAFASNMDFSLAMKRLNMLQGTWYSIENPSQSITFDGGKFQGNKIVALRDVAGGGGTFGCELDFIEDGSMKTRHLSAQDLGAEPHQFIAIDSVPYRKTKEPVYGESVGGIYLGMPYQKVFELYGSPDIIHEFEGSPRAFEIGYTKIGLSIRFIFSIAEGITLYSYGDRRLDKSLLSCDNSLDEFKAAYGIEKFHEKSSNSIGNGEYLWFDRYPQSITLSTYSF